LKKCVFLQWSIAMFVSSVPLITRNKKYVLIKFYPTDLPWLRRFVICFPWYQTMQLIHQNTRYIV